MTGLKNSSVLLHMIENTFYNIDATGGMGGMELYDTTARLLAEGNSFTNGGRIVQINLGSIFLPLTPADCNMCTAYIGRPCEVNILVNSTTYNATDLRVLNDLKPYVSVLTKPRSTANNTVNPANPNICNPGCL